MSNKPKVQNSELKKQVKSLDENRAKVIDSTEFMPKLTLTLTDIDTAILYYFSEIILPIISSTYENIKIPLIYSNTEKWNHVRKDGYYRSQDGKLQIPLITFRRIGLEKNRTLSNKIDDLHPVVYMHAVKKWSDRNRYIDRKKVKNINEEYEVYNIIIPDYVTINYEFIIWTDTIELMNSIVEAINYSADSYWGIPEKFKFKIRIDNFNDESVLVSDNDRVIRTRFNMVLKDRKSVV